METYDKKYLFSGQESKNFLGFLRMFYDFRLKSYVFFDFEGLDFLSQVFLSYVTTVVKSKVLAACLMFVG